VPHVSWDRLTTHFRTSRAKRAADGLGCFVPRGLRRWFVSCRGENCGSRRRLRQARWEPEPGAVLFHVRRSSESTV